MSRTRLVLTFALVVAVFALPTTPTSAQRPKRGNNIGGNNIGGNIGQPPRNNIGGNIGNPRPGNIGGNIGHPQPGGMGGNIGNIGGNIGANPGGGMRGDIEHHMDPNGWQPPNKQPNFPNNNKGMEDAEKAAQSAGRAITGGMIAMGIVSLLFGVAILGGTGFLVMKSGQVADGSAAGGSRRRKRSSRDD